MLERLTDIPRGTWRDAVRRGVQSALAAVGAYALARWAGSGEAYIAVLGAVLILQPSVGGTMGTAATRLQATLVGSLLGLGCLLLLPEGWGTAAALALSMAVVGGAAGLRSDWSYGAVAAVGVALVPEAAMVETAVARGLALAMGAGVGVAVSLLVWPDRAEARFDRHLRAAMRAAATRLSDAVEAAMEPGREADPPGHVSAFHEAMGKAQAAMEAAKFVDRAGMGRRLDALRRLYNSVVILDRAAGAAPAAGDEGLREEVAGLRRDACAVLTALAEGRREAGREIGGIDAALGRLEAALARDDPASEAHRGRGALAFGLGEVRRTLAAVVEAEEGA